jgi:hypothetical protein
MLAFEPPATSIRFTAVVDFAHVHQHRTVMRASNGFVLAAPVTVLLVHFDGNGATGFNGTFSCNAL